MLLQALLPLKFYNMNKDHNVVIISGATGYLGSAIAKRMAADGMRVAVLYKNASEDVAQTSIASLEGTGHAAYRCDLSNKEEITQTLERIIAQQGMVGACVHVAWTKPIRKQLTKCSVEEAVMQSNENIPMSLNFLSTCADIFRKQEKGIIIGITTAGVVREGAAGNLGGYIVAKNALQGILSAYKEELKNSGVRVYSVAPDFMEGGMNADIPRAFVEMIKEKSVTKMLVTPEDVAAKISFLCSEEGKGETNLTFLISPGNDTQ